jgi:hypothetical protein
MRVERQLPQTQFSTTSTVLESETRLAINALGLDAGLGLPHADTASRDSLVYYLMEPVRPRVDAYLFDWISDSPLKRGWFFEEGDGKCRLMAEIAKQLTLTTDTWSREIAPVAEWFVKELCSQMLDMTKLRRPGTRLTQERRRVAVGSVVPDIPAARSQQRLCEIVVLSFLQGVTVALPAPVKQRALASRT